MSAASSHAVTASIRSLSEGLFHIEHQPFEILPFGVIDVDRVVGRLRELVQDAHVAAAEKTVVRNSSFVTACEQEKVKRMPPGRICDNARALRRLYPCMALPSTLWCLAKAGGSRMIRS